MAETIKWEGRTITLTEDSCRECGYEFASVDALWGPKVDLWPGCDDGPHEHPAENERRQHTLGHHRYRAWTKVESERQAAKAAEVIRRWTR